MSAPSVERPQAGRVGGARPRPGRQLPADPTRRPRHRADVQGLRALAVLLVVAYHADLPVPGGFVGVDVFFVISGFVITAMLVAELEAAGRIDLPRFYVRRARRLLPALALMLTTVLLLAALVSPIATQGTAALTGMAASVFAANAYLLNVNVGYFDVGSELNPLLHTWTLGVEEQFYVVFPLLLLAGWLVSQGRPGVRKAVAAAVLALVCVGSLLLFLSFSGGFLRGDPKLTQIAFFASPARAWEFGAGALLALGTPLVARLPRRLALTLGALGVAAVAAAAFADGILSLQHRAAVVAVLGTCALVAAGTASTGGAGRLLRARPAVWVGDLSYSLYLWHWPLIVFATALWPAVGWVAPAAALVSLLPAWLSYRFVENPIRFGGRWRVDRRALAVLVLVCILAPVAAAGALLGAKSALASTATFQSWERSQERHADVVRQCDASLPLSARAGAACTWTVSGARGHVVLVGDSNAGHFVEPVVEAAGRAGLDLTVTTFSACPFVDVDLVGILGAEGDDACRLFKTGTLAEIARLEPTLVIAAARPDKYIENPEYRLRDGSGRLVESPDEKAALWRAGLERTLAALGEAGVPVLVVHPVPYFEATPQRCTTLGLLAGGCGSTMSLAEARERLRRARAAEVGAVAAAANAASVDFEGSLCADGRCSTSRGGVVLYRDGEHLSVEGSLTLADEFHRAIVRTIAARGGS